MSEAVEAPPKRKRGRPRKNPLPESLEQADTQPQPEPAKVRLIAVFPSLRLVLKPSRTEWGQTGAGRMKSVVVEPTEAVQFRRFQADVPAHWIEQIKAAGSYGTQMVTLDDWTSWYDAPKNLPPGASAKKKAEAKASKARARGLVRHVLSVLRNSPPTGVTRRQTREPAFLEKFLSELFGREFAT